MRSTPAERHGAVPHLFGQVQLFLSGAQMRDLAVEPGREYRGLSFKVESPLIGRKGGSYKAVFDVILV